MKVLQEAGVLPRSERFFSTPSATARRVFFYITRCGHYYMDKDYDFHDTCEIGREESHRNYFLLFVRTGTMALELDGEQAIARAGQCAIADCRRPHRFHALGAAESLWIHFDGANAAALFAEILAKSGGRRVLSPPGDGSVERELAAVISCLRSGAPLREVDYSEKIYRVLCSLLFPETARAVRATSPVARAMEYMKQHLHETLPVERVAAAVHLSSAHFSREFRAHTGFSPHEFIVLHRIDEAKALLMDTDLTIGQIAFRVGYKSEVNFIASFRSKVGSSPTTFRRNLL